MAARAGEPWFEDSSAALQAEQAGEFESDAELGELALREFKFYFARYGDAEREYLESLSVDVPNADTLRYFNKELFETFDLRPQLGEITAPALVVTGDEDFITGPVCANELAEHLGDVRKVVIPGAGHFVFVEAPDAFRGVVFDFLGV
jgi:pimeloyl-ACP methyl ester carboxylesterase